MVIRHLICSKSTCESRTLITPFKALASSSHLLRSQSPALRLAQVSQLPFSSHVIRSYPYFLPFRYIEHLVRIQSKRCLPSRDQSQAKSMTWSILVAAAEAQPVRYASPLSTRVQAVTASCVASRCAPWREDCHHRGIGKTGRYLRKRWWVSLL